MVLGEEREGEGKGGKGMVRKAKGTRKDIYLKRGGGVKVWRVEKGRRGRAFGQAEETNRQSNKQQRTGEDWSGEASRPSTRKPSKRRCRGRAGRARPEPAPPQLYMPDRSSHLCEGLESFYRLGRRGRWAFGALLPRRRGRTGKCKGEWGEKLLFANLLRLIPPTLLPTSHTSALQPTLRSGKTLQLTFFALSTFLNASSNSSFSKMLRMLADLDATPKGFWAPSAVRPKKAIERTQGGEPGLQLLSNTLKRDLRKVHEDVARSACLRVFVSACFSVGGLSRRRKRVGLHTTML